jgi:sugar lactone lactonase YvrE
MSIGKREQPLRSRSASGREGVVRRIHAVALYVCAVALLPLPCGGKGVSGQAAPLTTAAAPSAVTLIETLAGGGDVGDGGPATSARLSLPGGVLLDADDDLVIVDFGNHRIRRVSRKTGVITTLAGDGTADFSGDGGPAALARLARPENAAFGPGGDLYVVDSHNHRVRRIEAATGVITTAAGSGRKGFSGDGGPAREALLNQPEGIAFDAEGNFYIGDTLNGRVRKVDGRTGVISTIAGTGEVGTSGDGTPALEAKFLRLARLIVDRRGRLYIADSPSHRVQVLNPQDGKLWTIAGTGREGFSGDGGPATEARLSYPEGVALDAQDNLYFADLGNHRVRRVDAATGVITTVAGNGEKGFGGDGSAATSARLWNPGRLGFDSAGNLYIADISNMRIRCVERKTGIIRTVVGSGELGDGGPASRATLAIPGDLAYAGGNLYITEFGNRRVRCVNLKTGRITTVAGGGTRIGEGISANEYEFVLPEAIAVSPAGMLYVADSLGNRVLEVNLKKGTIHTFAGTGEAGYTGDGGPAASARFFFPGALSVGVDGSVYIVDFGNHRIRVVDPVTRIVRTLEDKSEHAEWLRVPVISLAVADRQIYWANTGDSNVYRMNLSQRSFLQMPLKLPRPLNLSGESQIGDLAIGRGSLFVADTLAHLVLQMNLRTGKITVFAGNGLQGFSGDGGPAQKASLFRPGAIAVGAGGELFVADTFNHRVRKVWIQEGSREQ